MSAVAPPPRVTKEEQTHRLFCWYQLHEEGEHFGCKRHFEVSARTERRVRAGQRLARCQDCQFTDQVLLVKVEQEHIDFWLNGGLNGDLLWEEIEEIACGLFGMGTGDDWIEELLDASK